MGATGSKGTYAQPLTLAAYPENMRGTAKYQKGITGGVGSRENAARGKLRKLGLQVNNLMSQSAISRAQASNDARARAAAEAAMKRQRMMSAAKRFGRGVANVFRGKLNITLTNKERAKLVANHGVIDPTGSVAKRIAANWRKSEGKNVTRKGGLAGAARGLYQWGHNMWTHGRRLTDVERLAQQAAARQARYASQVNVVQNARNADFNAREAAKKLAAAQVGLRAAAAAASAGRPGGVRAGLSRAAQAVRGALGAAGGVLGGVAQGLRAAISKWTRRNSANNATKGNNGGKGGKPSGGSAAPLAAAAASAGSAQSALAAAATASPAKQPALFRKALNGVTSMFTRVAKATGNPPPSKAGVANFRSAVNKFGATRNRFNLTGLIEAKRQGGFARGGVNSPGALVDAAGAAAVAGAANAAAAAAAAAAAVAPNVAPAAARAATAARKAGVAANNAARGASVTVVGKAANKAQGQAAVAEIAANQALQGATATASRLENMSENQLRNYVDQHNIGPGNGKAYNLLARKFKNRMAASR